MALRRENSKSPKSPFTRYAALDLLVNVANRLNGPDKKRRPIEVAFPALARILVRAQRVAGTPQEKRVGKVTFEWTGEVLSALVFEHPSSLSPYRIDPDDFLRDAEVMVGVLQEVGEEWLFQKSKRDLLMRMRPFNVLRMAPDFTLDYGPELFTDTLKRATAGRDMRRIRRCPECERLFIAIPSDKVACSPKCASAVRVHKFLAENPGYYTQEQRERRRNRKNGQHK